MKILLIIPPVWNDVGVHKSDSPPLSLLYLAGYLEKYGYPDVRVVDADVEKMTWQNLRDLFAKENPDIVGIGGASLILPALIKTAQIARETLPDSLIVAGGFGPSTEPEKVLRFSQGAIDLVVVKEGEQTLLETVKRRESGSRDFGDIAGLIYLNKEGKLITTKSRDYIMDLDSIPWPAFHLLTSDFSKYPGAPFTYYANHKEIQRPIATMVAARGCPHRCTFCSLGQKAYRQRNPKDIVDEMEFYKNKFKAKSLQIYDDEFIGMSPQQNEWVKDICDELLKRNLNLSWMVQGRCSPYIDLATLKKMRAAGCRWIWFGVESGSQRLLDEVIQKDIKVADVYRAFDLAKTAGIKTLMFIMIGFPTETPADIKLTADLIKKVKPDETAIHILTPYPGSKLRKYFEEHDLLDNKLEKLEDYYKYDTELCVNHHTYEMTAQDINKYYRLLYFRFCNNWRYFIKFGLKSLTRIEGWRKLFKRVGMAINYFWGWLKINFKNKKTI